MTTTTSPLLNTAQWIWLPGEREALAPNTFVAFRRTISVHNSVAEAAVQITADARYELFVNGVWVGHGPARSFSSPWPVDSYEIGHLLHEGENVVAVLVQHFGIGTFQYLPGEPGLLCEIIFSDNAGEHVTGTDTDWRCIRHEGFALVTPRISCQQAWEEQFDATKSPGSGWTAPDFDDSNWRPAAIQREIGAAPHEVLEPRDIPFLTREPIYPARLLRTDVVQPATYTWSLNPRWYLNSEDLSANQFVGRMFLATHIWSDHEQTVQFHAPHGTPSQWKLNAVPLIFDDRTLQSTDSGVAEAALRPGWNVLLVKLPERRHLWTCVVNIWSEEPLSFRGQPDLAEQPPWIAIGPFEGAAQKNDRSLLVHADFVETEKTMPGATSLAWESIWELGELTAADLALSRPLTPDMICPADIFAVASSERIVPGAPVQLDEPQALIEDNGNWTTIQPSEYGEVRLLLDYGKEIVGNHEFEIDAPEGTIVDFHDFEFIQRDGRINLCEGMNNSFRYICRDGFQTYRTFVRHGLRYSWISLRNFGEPIRLRAVRVIQSTYPMAQQGTFDCSDPLLTEIWKVGAHSVRCCAEDTYTDCPTYEQTFWVGDGRNEALVDLVANGDPRLSRHCWIQAGRSLDRSKLVEAQVPSSWLTILPAWSFLWMRWAHEHFLLTGDTEFGTQALTFLQRNAEGIEEYLDERDLFQINAWNMFDWAPMDTPSDGIVTHQICLAVLGLRQTAELARLLGDSEKSAAWDTLADRMAAAVNAHLWSDDRQAYLDCIRHDGTDSPIFSQQTQTAAFISGVATGERAVRCREIIEKAPEGFVPAGSPFYMFFVLETLVKEGRSDLLLQTIREYWGTQIAAGATAYWEMYYPDAERHTRSHCHGWSAAPTFFLSQQVLGIQPLTPGYQTIVVRPQIADLRWAHGRVPTPNGNVECYWKRTGEANNEQFDLQLNWPVGIELEIELPYAGTLTITEGQIKAQLNPTHLKAAPTGHLKLTLQKPSS